MPLRARRYILRSSFRVGESPSVRVVLYDFWLMGAHTIYEKALTVSVSLGNGLLSFQCPNHPFALFNFISIRLQLCGKGNIFAVICDPIYDLRIGVSISIAVAERDHVHVCGAHCPVIPSFDPIISRSMVRNLKHAYIRAVCHLLDLLSQRFGKIDVACEQGDNAVRRFIDVI